MKRILILSALSLISLFLLGASCGSTGDARPECYIDYSTADGVPEPTCSQRCYAVVNTGNCAIYTIDILFNLIMETDVTLEVTRTVGPVWNGETSSYGTITICGEGAIDYVDFSYVITGWEVFE